MTSAIKSPRDFWTGIWYAAFGCATVLAGSKYGLGTATRMGPGYFPVMLGTLLVIIGIASLIRSFLRSGEPVGKFALKQAVLILGAVLLFGLLIRPAGLVIALIVLVVGSSCASDKFNWKVSLLLSAGLVAFSSLVFVKGLGVPLPLFGSWFGA